MLPLVLAILLTAGAQSPPVDRSRAEELARTGRTAEAIALFERIVKSNPADVEASSFGSAGPPKRKRRSAPWYGTTLPISTLASGSPRH